MDTTLATPWLKRWGPPGGRLRLYCFSYAGGNASTFRNWPATLGEEIEVWAVQLPGRAARLHEQPWDALPPLIEQVAAAIVSHGPGPFAFFGHSLGALLAFEVARHLEPGPHGCPQHLFASACNPPQYRQERRHLHALPVGEFIAELAQYQGTPAELLANSELMALVLPALRADFCLAEKYVYRPGARLSTPITVLSGRDDRHTDAALQHKWQEETSAPCRVEWFDGAHFFLEDQMGCVLACVGAELQGVATPERAAPDEPPG
jgi:medium-chain acyl-[acyl-carrier-protein] hydrolase